MLENPTETLQRRVGAGPAFKGWRQRGDHRSQGCEIAVMKTAPPGQLPNPFDRIEFRAVGRQKMQGEVANHCASPSFMKVGMVIASIVDDDHHFPAWTAVALQFPVEVPAGAGVKRAIGPGHDQFAVLEAHGAEKADALSRRSMQTNRIVHFGRHPHAAARAVLLKVNFIHGPQINVVPSRQCAEFFCAWLAKTDRPAPLADAAFVSGSPTDGITVGTGALSISLPALEPKTPTGWDHPTGPSPGQTFEDWRATPPRFWPVAGHSIDWDVQGADLRPNQPDRRSRSAAPSSRRCGGHPPAIAPRWDRSCLVPRAKRRGADDHSGRRRYAESHPGWP